MSNATNGKLREFETTTASTYDPDEAARARKIFEAGQPLNIDFVGDKPERAKAAAVPAVKKGKEVGQSGRFKELLAAAGQKPAADTRKLSEFLEERFLGKRRR